MPLSPGTTLGPYSVTAKIGAGGMGEVYQARDTKLDRDVALKVLPDAFTSDADRLARFEREAKVLASLNRPTARRHLQGSRPKHVGVSGVTDFRLAPDASTRPTWGQAGPRPVRSVGRWHNWLSDAPRNGRPAHLYACGGTAPTQRIVCQLETLRPSRPSLAKAEGISPRGGLGVPNHMRFVGRPLSPNQTFTSRAAPVVAISPDATNSAGQSVTATETVHVGHDR